MSIDKLLIVTACEHTCSSVRSVLVAMKLGAVPATSAEGAAACLAKESFDVVLVDSDLPENAGEELLKTIASKTDRPLVIILNGADASTESVVLWMRAGAHDCLQKPLDAVRLKTVLIKAEESRQRQNVSQLLSDGTDDADAMLVGEGASMKDLRLLINRVAPTDATVLLTGESGTGKEMVAREFYRKSSRRAHPFIRVNCAAIPENLIESEFFGHEKGAFTGATERREGRFELAQNGTLMLDEVSEIPLALQAKLLRVLQEREFERVGGSRTIKVNVRIIATSNRRLIDYVAQGKFRQDLYYRLNVFPVKVPSLRERAEDIPVLADHFLRRYTRKHGIKATGFSEAAKAAMISYRWPGNVRELQNSVERAVIMAEPGRVISETILGIEHDQPSISAGNHDNETSVSAVHQRGECPACSARPEGRNGSSVNTGHLTLEEIERQAIEDAIRRHNGNRSQAAKALGITARTLRNKLQSYGQDSLPAETV